MNEQQVFDKVLDGLRKQGCISVDEGGECMYRGVNGTKCGIGMLIADEHYHEGLEENSVFEPRVVEALSLSGIDIDSDLLVSIQNSLHDTYSSELQKEGNIKEYPAWLEHQAKYLATTFNLNYSETTS